jgi:hypothetical protein
MSSFLSILIERLVIRARESQGEDREARPSRRWLRRMTLMRSAFTNGAPSEASEHTAHYHGRYKGVAGEWHLYAVAQNT